MSSPSLAIQEALQSARRIVIKLGTQIVIEKNALALVRVTQIVHQVAQLRQQGKEVILVSSGAVGLGKQQLKLTKKLALIEKQACAAVGQGRLMNVYQQLFDHYGLTTAQVLLTGLDVGDRKHYLNLRQTLEKLLAMGVIPVINENDSVSTMELQEEGYTKSFGDNDKLSALVASKLDADLLVILTNVDGLYTDNPATNPDAAHIPLIENFQTLQGVNTAGQSLMGRGGMSTKLEAARLAAMSGLYTWITSGLNDQPMGFLTQPKSDQSEKKGAGKIPFSGTVVLPQGAIRGKRRWIGTASGYYGVIKINAGAQKALTEKQASLLPVGITSTEGEFSAGQVVSIQDEEGHELGRGVSQFSAKEIAQIQGLQSQDIAGVLNKSGRKKQLPQEVIHRDYLVVY